MIRGFFIVNACGALIYHDIQTDAFSEPVNIDKLIAMASTIYTGMEILSDAEVCRKHGKYTRLTAVYKIVSLTALKIGTGLIFVTIHDNVDPISKIIENTDRIHKLYIENILYDPEYYVDDRISKKFSTASKDERH